METKVAVSEAKPFWESKKVVVTGGYGFLGSWVTQKLLDRGATVVPLSRRVGCDLRNRYCAQYWFLAAKPEIVINCAALQGGIAFQETGPAEIFESNLLICTNTLWAAYHCGAKKYVDVVAGCAYPGGVRGKALLNEDYIFDGPVHPSVTWYATTKRTSIVHAQAYREQFGFDAISLVLINLYGPGEHFAPGRSHALAALLRKFYEAKRNDRPQVFVWGTGRPVREWTYVEDAAEGIVRATELYSTPEPMNIATGRGLSIMELAELIKDIVGYEGQIVYDTSKSDGAPRKVADVRRMREYLNWQPTTKLKDGIERTFAWLDEHYEEIK